MIFETDFKRLTGLYFVLSVLFPLFLYTGVHFDIFQHSGKIPCSRELFIIQVSGRVMTSTDSLSTLVLMKSTPLDVLDLTFLIALLTWDSVTLENSKLRFLPLSTLDGVLVSL